MTGPSGAAGAGRTERKRDAPKVREQPCGVDAVAADVEIALVAALNATVDGPVRAKCLRGRCPQPLHMVVVSIAALGGELGRGAEADAERRRQRSRTHPLLLPAAVDERRRLRSLAHPQGADAFWTVNLMGRDRQHVRTFGKR